MIRFEDAAAKLPDVEKDIVLAALTTLLSFGDNYTRRFAANIKIEFRVAEEVWDDVFAVLVALKHWPASAAGATTVADAFREVFRGHLKQVASVTSIESRQPVGPAITGLSPGAYGRIASFKQLTSLWQWAAPATGAPRSKPALTPLNAKLLIESIATPAGLAIQKKYGMLAECPLGRFVIWSTFDGETMGDDPFVPRTAMADLMAHLGLDSLVLFDRHPRSLSDPGLPPCFCVMLKYALPPPMAVHVPTVVEAYAGPGRMNFYFEVWQGGVNAADGLFPRTLADPYDGHSGHPEIVHPIVFADQLTAPVEIERVA